MAYLGSPGPQSNASNSLAVSIGPFDAAAVDPLSTSLSPDSGSLSSGYPYSAITPVSGLPWMPQDELAHELGHELTPSASPSGFSATPPPDFDAHDMGMMYAPAPEQLAWGQDVAIAHDAAQEAMYAPQTYVDANGMPMQDYSYGVEQYPGQPPCGMEADGFHYTEEIQYHHHPVEISQY